MATTALLLAYHDVQSARHFFITALGFEEEWAVTDEDGKITRSHLELGDARLMIDVPGTHGVQSPRDVGGVTQLVVVGVDDVDAHYERAVAGGASTDGPPRDESWGGRAYMVTDSGGYLFQFYEAR